MSIQPYPDSLFAPQTKHLLSIAHQDDEINYTGLMQRWGKDVHFIWMTNGDGLAPFVNEEPLAYAEKRKTETDEVLKTLGRSLDDRICLDYSEIEIYSKFVDVEHKPEKLEEIVSFMHGIGNKIYREIKEFMPDVVWSGQYQQGHPEHDLCHLLTAIAVKQLKEETGKEIAFYHLPEYEYTIFIPMRFNPFYKGVRHTITLNEEEYQLKRKALECYPSQVELFDKFEKVINRLGFCAKIIGKGFDAEDFLKTEHFGPVPEDIDYTKSYHKFEWANYMFDDYEGVKVHFNSQIAVLAGELCKMKYK